MNPVQLKNFQSKRRRETTGLKILLIEDNQINQKMTRSLLMRRSHQVSIANNGFEGIQMASQEKYDLLLVDIQMPGMDGFEVAQSLRLVKGPNQQTPIIALTAHALPGDRQRCLDAGMDDYLTKPIDPQKMFEMIERWGAKGISPLGSEYLPFTTGAVHPGCSSRIEIL